MSEAELSTPPADGNQAREPDWEFPMGITLVVGEGTNNGPAAGLVSTPPADGYQAREPDWELR